MLTTLAVTSTSPTGVPTSQMNRRSFSPGSAAMCVEVVCRCRDIRCSIANHFSRHRSASKSLNLLAARGKTTPPATDAP
jgi:hypothetical protein